MGQKATGGLAFFSDTAIKELILPHLSQGKRGFKSLDLTKILLLIFKRLKTGSQWRELSIKEFFPNEEITWQGVYYHFNKWCKDDSWKNAWVALLSTYKHKLDLSCIQLDGSHTPAKNGGGAVGYQGRKSCKTSNSLFICDNNGQMLAVCTPQSGEHNDLYEISTLFKEMTAILTSAGIETKGLFLNADPGFDAVEFRATCSEMEIEANIKENPRSATELSEAYQYFDLELYKRRSKIEHANAWIDSFKALRMRFEKNAKNWMAMQWMGFIALLCRKLKV